MAESDAGGRERSFTALPKPEADEPQTTPERRRGLFELPDGALAIFFLLILAAVSGGLIAVYWPWMAGGADTTSTNDRLATLETRVGQIATGQAPKAAAASFQDLHSDISAFKDRIDADEARLMALEKTTGASEGTDVATVKTALDRTNADLQQLNLRIAKLELSSSTSTTARLDAAGKAVQDLRKDLDTRAQSLNDAMSRLEARIGALEKTAPPADLAVRLDALALKSDAQNLDARIARLEAKDVTSALHRAASLLAVTGLARATQSDKPFETEFNAVKALLPDAPEIAQLAPLALKVIPTHAQLREQLDRDSGAILSAARDAKAKNWLERLIDNLKSLVTVRRVGEMKGDDPEARLARADGALASDNLESAIAEISALKGPPAAAAAHWLKDARARNAIDRAVAGLSSKVVLMLAAPLPDASQGPHP